jgi:TetR/AcrR family transcriptional repressor of nem operon
MGRTRKVDSAVARESALSAFWVHGYKGLGVRKLEELTGINRFALQTEFGGKDGLFFEILDMYASTWKDNLEVVRSGNLDHLAAYFIQRASKNGRYESNSGCLVFNTLSGDTVSSPEIIKKIESLVSSVQRSFSYALKNEKALGTLKGDLDIGQTSQMLVSSLIGMNIYIKMKGKNEAALPTAKSLKNTIMSWRVPAHG